MINILLSSIGRRNYLVSYFNQALDQSGRIVGIDQDLTAPALQMCDTYYKVPNVFEPDYLDEIISVILKENVNMVFPLNDLDLFILAKNCIELEKKTNAKFYVPSLPTLKICTDKFQTFKFAKKVDIFTPQTYLSLDDALNSIDLGILKFPLVIKARQGSASIGLSFAGSRKELKNNFIASQNAISKNPLSMYNLNNSLIIQEFINGVEFGLDILFGLQGNYIGFAAKRKIAMRAGETDKAITVEQERFIDVVKKIVLALSNRGNLDCDFIESNGKLYLLDLNPRFGGGYPFTHLAGANHVEILINDFQEKKILPYDYKKGKVFAKHDYITEVSCNLGNFRK